MGRRGVVWDREGEEGIRVIQRKGMGREEKGRKEGKEMTWPPNKIPGSATGSQCAAAVPVYLTNVVILKMLSTS
jgi:hypothetical protein